MRRALVLLLAPVLLLAVPSRASAAAGEVGYDVSYPQCGKAAPTGGAFLVVGVNNGLPWSSNPCLAEQVGWASGTPWELYVNTADRGPESPYWPDAGTGYCATGAFDAGCAYEYGRAGATDALSRAVTALGATAKDRTWWLDVELANSWNGTSAVNAAALQGFADALRQGGVPEVGVYSTSYQWGQITGGYHRANAVTYRTQWPLGMPTHPLEDGPVWFAGVTTQADAVARCATAQTAPSRSFTGGERLLSQYLVQQEAMDFDADYRCRDRDAVAPTATTTGPASLVSTGSTIRVSWSGTDTGGAGSDTGLASFDLRTTRAPSDGPFGAWSEPLSMQRLLTTSKDVSRPAEGWTACFTSRSRDIAGNVSPWAPAMRCTAVPLDDRRFAASTGWTRGTTSGWFNGTSTSTTRYGATLTRSNLVTKRLHLLALRCPTCGKVGVYVGGKLVGTVSLASSTTGRVTVALPTFPLVRAAVTLKVLTSGKLVRVDGVATSSR